MKKDPKSKCVFDTQNITNRDLDILNLLWESSTPLTASEILKKNNELTMNTIQAVLRKLLRNGYIEVADVVYSGTVLCRSYRPLMSSTEFALSKITADYMTYGRNLRKTSLVASLLDAEENPQQIKADIQDLEDMLAEYKKGIQQ
ncbi:MAG: BlaI/MecI/CopY family transcriptional regulator [Lachnospiraceae bacterium]|nr:BlaI/MecI/CopY family transcriptional regulator [Lachnospiraceae bacterium]MDE6940293.1 BlaI/MecI/CopY family transcriptional regulator [Lachnospiraceae bacterium]